MLSYVRSAQGDIAGAIEAAENASEQALLVGDSRAIILATKMLGTAALLQNDLHQAQAYLGVAIELYQGGRELNPGPAARDRRAGRSCSTTRARTPRPRTCCSDCRQLCEERGEKWLLSYALWAIALTQRAIGRIAEAVANAKESMRIKRLLARRVRRADGDGHARRARGRRGRRRAGGDAARRDRGELAPLREPCSRLVLDDRARAVREGVPEGAGRGGVPAHLRRGRAA